LAAAGHLVFRSPLDIQYLVFPFLGWAAWRFGQRGAAPAALLVVGIAVWAAVDATGPFAHHTLAGRMVTLQVFDASAAFASFVLAALFIDRARAGDELRRSEERVSGLLASAPVAILVVSEDGIIQQANARGEAIFGYGPGELAGLSVEALLPEGLTTGHVAHRAGYMEDPRPRPMGSDLGLAGKRKDGTEFPVEIGLSSFGSLGGRLVTCIISDITRRKRAEEELAFLAYHDKLTGLANRARFDDHLNMALARARRADGAVAVLSIDLDDLKLVNDRLGHAAGDRLIAESAARLRSAARQTDLVARHGGDEFLILLADLPRGPAGSFADAVRVAEDVAERIREELRVPLRIGDAELLVTASVGISIYPLDAADARALLRNSDVAMYRSKESKDGRCVRYGAGGPGTDDSIGASLPLDRTPDGRVGRYGRRRRSRKP
jgi:diguanylate cyclase (GGDEF)-like protein/PAS domain S-box-containing protein